MSGRVARRRWLDASVTVNLADLVRNRWAVLFEGKTFAIAEEEDARVVLTSLDVRIAITFDPRGEVDVQVFPPEREPWQGWRYSGMVGRASLARLLDLALETMQRDPAVLSGDPALYDDLAAKADTSAEDWTAFYAGRGPRPGKRQLP